FISLLRHLLSFPTRRSSDLEAYRHSRSKPHRNRGALFASESPCRHSCQRDRLPLGRCPCRVSVSGPGGGHGGAERPDGPASPRRPAGPPSPTLQPRPLARSSASL